MKVSLSWLKDYVSIELKVSELVDALTMVGLEVDSATDRFSYLDTVLVGRIDAIEDHPQADKLRICKVVTADSTLSVVCGAPNVQVGMLAPLALPGTVFPSDDILEKSVIRGEVSEGMLCSEVELGLGENSGGIMVLDPALRAGDKLASALKLSDTVIEIDLTPNRPDCLSVIGIAREIAAIQNSELRYPEYHIEDSGNHIADLTSVTIEAPDHCPRYAARLLENISVTPAPYWLQDRLLSVGLRPINNIVDVTNFVMLETGQPLHAFDFDRLSQNRIVVRTATSGEKFTTLDQKERLLDSNTLMICDGEKAVAIGGVMGGLNSEIENSTTRVLIEGAYFNPVSIRKTSKKLGLNTDASHRFERGVDPAGTLQAVNRASALMAKVGGGALVSGIIDEHPQPQQVKRIPLSTAKTNRLLGTELDRDRIQKLLASIEFKVDKSDDNDPPDMLTVCPPTFRVDVTRPEDLMEEVARLSGYNNIPTTFPAMPAEGSTPAPQLELRHHIKHLMTGFGFMEAVTYSFIHAESCDRLRLPADDHRRRLVNVLNPLSEDQAVMRTSLIPGLLDTMRHNNAQQIKNLQIFEIGKIFLNEKPDQLPLESEILAGLWTGARFPSSWNDQDTDCDFFDIKGAVEGLFNALKVQNVHFTLLPAENCHYTKAGTTARILVGDEPVGLIGEIHSRMGKNLGLKQRAFIFEIEVDHLRPLISAKKYTMPVPKFPAVFRDITIIVEKSAEAQKVLETVKNMNEELVEHLHLFGVFDGKPIPAGKKSLSFRVTYRSNIKTLEDVDVSELHKNITAKLIAAFDASLPT